MPTLGKRKANVVTIRGEGGERGKREEIRQRRDGRGGGGRRKGGRRGSGRFRLVLGLARDTYHFLQLLTRSWQTFVAT